MTNNPPRTEQHCMNCLARYACLRAAEGDWCDEWLIDTITDPKLPGAMPGPNRMEN
jgi:hypothetical protein